MSTLIQMWKDGESIKVSPLCVEDHERLGWRKAEDAAASISENESEANSESEPDQKPKAPKAKGN